MRKGTTMTINEVRQVIPDFPRYEISNLGRVYNRETRKEMRLTPVSGGDLSVGLMGVGLMGDGRQYRRSVKVLVAKAFVENPDPEIFDTPVVLDGDDFHLHADNIKWRPRWFAIAYKKQIENPLEVYWAGPVVEHSTGVVYNTVMEAAMETGSLPSDILLSMTNDEEYPPVFPNRQKYDVKG